MGSLWHTWSLSVEEQFYLVWPLVLLLVLRVAGRPWLLAGTVVIGGLSAILLATNSGPSEWYATSTFTQASGILAGAALALIDRRWLSVKVAIVAALGILAVSVAFWNIDYSGPIGYLPVTLLSVVLIGAGGFAWAPLVWVGKFSYGLYLWHYVMLKTILWIDPWLVAVASIAVAWASYRYLERPFLRDRLGRNTVSLDARVKHGLTRERALEPDHL